MFHFQLSQRALVKFLTRQGLFLQGEMLITIIYRPSLGSTKRGGKGEKKKRYFIL